MSEKNVPAKSVRSAENQEVGKDLFGAALKATCRMIVPVFVLFGAGLLVDSYLLQKAFYAIIGAILGFIVAGWLIYLQIKSYDKKKRTCCETSAETDNVKAANIKASTSPKARGSK